MAENPEKGFFEVTGTGIDGEWGVLEIQVPDVLEQARSTIDSVAELLLTFLNFAATILNAAKAFTLSFLDPLTGLIEGLLEIIESTIQGLQNLGVYLHGDWYLLTDGPEMRRLLGGFSAYERRMITRLLDPRDPNRPDFNKGTISVSFFIYTNSGDISGLMRNLTLLMGFMKLFGANKKSRIRSLGSVTDIRAKYGFDGNQGAINKPLFESLIDRQNEAQEGERNRQAGQPNIATLEWKLAAAPGNYASPVASFAPSGFLIEVSVDPVPYFIQYDVVPKGKAIQEQGDGDPPPPPNRVRGLVVDENGNTIQITGGSSQLKLDGGNFFETGEKGSSEPRLFLFKSTSSTETIPLDALTDGEDTYNQKTFYASATDVGALGGFVTGQVMSYSLKLEDMPKRASFDEDGKPTEVEETDTFFVRIRPVSERVKKANDIPYEVNYTALNQGVAPIAFNIVAQNESGEKVTYADRGETSAPIKITYPGANTSDYLKCLFTAVIIVALVRPDLLPALDEEGNFLDAEDVDWGEVDNKVQQLTGLEDLAKSLLPQITGYKNAELFYKGNFDVSARTTIYNRCAALTARMYRANNPTPAIQQLVVENCQPLLDFTLGEFVNDSGSKVTNDLPQVAQDVETGDNSGLTLIQALLSTDEFSGIGMNPASVGTVDDKRDITSRRLAEDVKKGNIPAYWEPQFYEQTNEETLKDSEDERVLDTSPLSLDELASDTVNEKLRREGPEAVFPSVQTIPEADKVVVKGSVTNAPVFYKRRSFFVTKITYCRNALEDLFPIAAFALNVAHGPLQQGSNPDGQWITTRVGLMFPSLDGFLDDILAWFKALISAGESIGKTIRQFIDNIQARIIEMQTMIQRVNAMIQNFLTLLVEFPSAAVLSVVSQGSEGIMQGLVTAGNKPQDGPGSYGAGVVLIGAGPALPKIIVDLIQVT